MSDKRPAPAPINGKHGEKGRVCSTGQYRIPQLYSPNPNLSILAGVRASGQASLVFAPSNPLSSKAHAYTLFVCRVYDVHTTVYMLYCPARQCAPTPEWSKYFTRAASLHHHHWPALAPPPSHPTHNATNFCQIWSRSGTK